MDQITLFFGTLATVASLVIIVVGLPAQIIKNYRRKSCDGMEPLLVYSAFVAYALWSFYGWTKPDWFIFVSQTPGLLMAFVLVFQLFYYRK